MTLKSKKNTDILTAIFSAKPGLTRYSVDPHYPLITNMKNEVQGITDQLALHKNGH